MSFQDFFKKEDEVIIETVTSSDIATVDSKPDEILRSNKFKIKNIYGTKFGTEYVMAKKYDEEEIKSALKDYKLKFDGKSIFVIN